MDLLALQDSDAAEPSSGPSRRRSSTHAFTIAPSVPESQRGKFAELMKKRQPPSCDACRTRKLKCSGRPMMIELGPEAIATTPCTNCKDWSLDCSYLYQRKRRGRRNRVVERLAEEQRARKSRGGDDESSGSDEDDHMGLEDGQARPPPPIRHDTDPIIPMNGSIDPSRITMAPGPSSARNDPFQTTWTPSAVLNTSNTRTDSTVGGTSVVGAAPKGVGGDGAGDAFTTTFRPPDVPGPVYTSPSIDLTPDTTASVGRHSIESIIPRDLAMRIIDLYFEHVYCIIPVIHRPSFMADLAAHEEERRPMLLALIMGMLALTLLHIPRNFFPGLQGDGVKKTSNHCLKACYSVIRHEMNAITVDLICIKYFTFVIHNINGENGLEAAAFGEALALAINLGLHREDTYPGLTPIEAERRRRVWFLIYNADKFEAIFRAKPVLLRSDEFVGPEATELPAELEDRAITEHGYLASSSTTPLIVGFNTMTKLVTIIGDLLVHERDVRRKPPRDSEAILTALRNVRKLQARVKAISDGLPTPFQLDLSGGNALPAPGWENVVRDQLDLFFQDPMASETAKDGYLVMRANIHVTLAMTRLRIIIHRDDILNLAGPLGTPSRNAAELVAADLGESVDWRLGVYQDLFNAVHGLPIQALAANGPSLVNKIRVVAVTLIDALPAQDYGDTNVQGIAAYLLDFLNIMTSIESQFSD